MSRLTLMLCVSSLVAACVASRSVVEGQPCPCAPGWTCDLSRNACAEERGGSGGGGVGGAGGSGGVGGTAGSGGGAGANEVCGATCSTPAGTLAKLTSAQQIYAAMNGRWLFCGAWLGPAPTDVIGVEFGPASSEPTPGGGTVGGDMYYLVAGPSGPVRGSGFAYQLTYDVSSSGSSFQLNMHPAPNSGFGGTFRYSPCPKEAEIVFVSTASGSTVLVPADGNSGGGGGSHGGAGGTGGAWPDAGASGFPVSCEQTVQQACQASQSSNAFGVHCSTTLQEARADRTYCSGPVTDTLADCGTTYRERRVYQGDAAYTYFYSAASGALVAIVHSAGNPTVFRCVGGPSTFDPGPGRCFDYLPQLVCLDTAR
jgi:hypothetical protein